MFLEPIENDLFCGTFQCMAKLFQYLSNALEYIHSLIRKKLEDTKNY